MSNQTYAQFADDVEHKSTLASLGVIDTYANTAGTTESIQGNGFLVDEEGDSAFKSATIRYLEFDELYGPRGDETPTLYVTKDAFISTHSTVRFANLQIDTIAPNEVATKKLTIPGSTPLPGYAPVAVDNIGTLNWQPVSTGSNNGGGGGGDGLFSDITSTGIASFNDLNASGTITANDLNASGTITANDLNASGTTTASDLNASGTITANALSDGVLGISSGAVTNVTSLTLNSQTASPGQILVATDDQGGVQWQDNVSTFDQTTINVNQIVASGATGTDGQVLTTDSQGDCAFEDLPTTYQSFNVTNSLSSANSALGVASCASLTSSGNVQAIKVQVTSDLRLKEDVKTLETDFDRVLALRPVSFKFKDQRHVQNGFVAQEVQQLIDNVVEQNDETGFLSMDTHGLVPHLLNCIKQLHARVAALESKL